MARKHKKNSPHAVCERLIEAGDVLGLFEYIRAQRVPLPPDLSLGGLGKCIRLKARKDLNGLSDDIFGAILGLGMNMLLRCQAYIENRLEENDRFAGQTSPLIPSDLINDRWIDRAERIARFCAEMAALRARVHHLNGIDDDRGDPNTSQGRPRLVSAMDDGAGEAGSSQGAPRTRRKRAGAT